MDIDHYAPRLWRLTSHFKLGPPSYLFLLTFHDRYFPPIFLPPPHPQPFLVEVLLFHLLPTSSPGAKRRPPGRRLYLPPATLCCLSLLPARRDCVCRRSCASVLPPLLSLDFTQILSAWGEFACRGFIRIFVSLPRPPLALFQILASSGLWSLLSVAFCEKARCQGASIPCQLRALVLAPPASFSCRRLALRPILLFPTGMTSRRKGWEVDGGSRVA